MRVSTSVLLSLLGVVHSKTFYIGWLDKQGGCWTGCGDWSNTDSDLGRRSATYWTCWSGGAQKPMNGEERLTNCYDGMESGPSISQVFGGFETAWMGWHDNWKTMDYMFHNEPWNFSMNDQDEYEWPPAGGDKGWQDTSDASKWTGPSSYMPNPLSDGRGFKKLFGDGTDADNHQVVMFRSDTQGTLSGTVSAALPLLNPAIPTVNKIQKCTLNSITCLQQTPTQRGCDFVCEDFTGQNLPQQVDLIIGPGLSRYTREIASIVNFYKVPHLMARYGDAAMSDKTDFPLFMRTNQSGRQDAETTIQFLKQMEWHRVGMLYSTSPAGQSFAAELSKQAHAHDVHITAFGVAEGSQPSAALKMLKAEGLRIILMAFENTELINARFGLAKSGMMKGEMGEGEEDFTYVWGHGLMEHREAPPDADRNIMVDFDTNQLGNYKAWVDGGGPARCETYTVKQRNADLYCQMVKCVLDPSQPCEAFDPEWFNHIIKKNEDVEPWDAEECLNCDVDDGSGVVRAKKMYDLVQGTIHSLNNQAGDIYIFQNKFRSPKEVEFVTKFHRFHRYSLDRTRNMDPFLAGAKMAYISVNGFRMMAELEEICTHVGDQDLKDLLNDEYSVSGTDDWDTTALRNRLVQEYYSENFIDPEFNEMGGVWTDQVLDQATLCQRFNNAVPEETNMGPFEDASGKNKLMIYSDAQGNTDGARGQIMFSLMRDSWIDRLDDRDRSLKTGDMYPNYIIATWRAGKYAQSKYGNPSLHGVEGVEMTNKCLDGRLVYDTPISGTYNIAGLKAPASPKCEGGAQGRFVLGYAQDRSGKFPQPIENTIPTGGITRRKVGVSWQTYNINQKLTKDTCVGCYWGIFRGKGHTPLDQPLLIRKQRRISELAKHVFTKLVVLGIIVAAFLLGFNFKLRNRRYIRMSSPNINNVILVGLVLVMIAVYPLSYDTWSDGRTVELTEEEKDTVFAGWCQQRVCFLAFGFTLAFEALFAKTYRVHKIFNAKLIGNVKITDMELFQIIGAFTVIDAAIITCWFLVDPMHRQVHEFPQYVNPLDNDEIILEWYETCNSTYMQEFTIAMYLYKGATLLAGAYLAWQTRNVEIPALNDSKWIGFAIYNVAVICMSMLPVLPFLSYHPEAWFTYAGVGIVLLATGVMGLIFFPKVYTVLMNEDEAATQSQMTRLQTSKLKKSTKWSSMKSARSKRSEMSKVSTMEQSTMD